MKQYEINYLVLQSKTAELPTIRQQVKELIKKLGGKITAEKEYLKRKLAYEIKHELFGFYTALRFKSDKEDFVRQLTKELNLNSQIARFIIVNAAELPALEETIPSTTKKEEKKELKPEEVEKVLAEKKTEETEKATISTATPKELTDSASEIGQSEASEQSKVEKTASTAIEPAPKKTLSKEEADALTNSPKTTTKDAKEGDKKDKKEEKEEKSSKKKLSLDELDEKLDEILNI